MSNDREFNKWMALVDMHVQQTVGLSVHDLPDWHFRDAFNDEMPPEEAAAEVLAEAGWEE